MKFASLFFLLILLPIAETLAQQTPWYLNEQPIRELEGPYITSYVVSRVPFLTASYLAVVQEKDTAEIGVFVPSDLYRHLLNYQLKDIDGEAIAVGNWASIANGFYRQGWRLVNTMNWQTSGGETSVTNNMVLILEKIKP